MSKGSVLQNSRGMSGNEDWAKAETLCKSSVMKMRMKPDWCASTLQMFQKICHA